MNIGDVLVAVVITGGVLLAVVAVCLTVLAYRHLEIARHRALVQPSRGSEVARHDGY